MIQLNIKTYPIFLDYTLQNAKLNLQSTAPNVIMETKAPSVEIRQPRGELIIDNTPYYYSTGRKNLADFARDNAELGRQTVLKTIASTVEEGNRLAKIKDSSNVIGELAFESRFQDTGQVIWSPIAAPNITYKASPAQINITPGTIKFSPQPGNVQGDYVPGSVDIRVTQYPRVEISTVDVKI